MRLSQLLPIVTLVSSVAVAGNLTPPVGPVAPTHKTLTEVEPRIAINATNTPGDADSVFRIAAPGSYYLTGNVAGAVGKAGIEIAASGVSIDLMGFELIGVVGSFSGVYVTFSVNVAVRHGSVRGWGVDGIDLTFAQNTRVSEVLVAQNGANGITGGVNATIDHCGVYSNADTGICIGTNGSITNCSIRQNGSNGIRAGTACAITACDVRDNAGTGLSTSFSSVTASAFFGNQGHGIITSGSVIEGCAVTANGLNGITVTSGCQVRNNSCQSNGAIGSGAGIQASDGGNRIEGNNCGSNDIGIDLVAAGNFYVRNTCSGNTTNWSVAAGNSGVIFTAATNAAGFSGNTGGLPLGSTDPWANWTY